MKFPPSFTLVHRRGKGACGQARGASRRRSALRTDSPAVLGLVALPHNSLRSLRSLRSNRRGKSEVVARCARGPRALRSSAPPRRAASLPARAFAEALVFPHEHRHGPTSRQAVPGGGDFWGEEQRRAGLGARSALRKLTRRICLSAVSEAHVASYATRARTEQRTAVGAQRRPPRHEPPPGTACGDARTPAPSSQTRKTARDSKQQFAEASFQTFFRTLSPNNPFGLMTSITSTTMYAAVSLNPSGR
jgi:hypothetical protein